MEMEEEEVVMVAEKIKMMMVEMMAVIIIAIINIFIAFFQCIYPVIRKPSPGGSGVLLLNH